MTFNFWVVSWVSIEVQWELAAEWRELECLRFKVHVGGAGYVKGAEVLEAHVHGPWPELDNTYCRLNLIEPNGELRCCDSLVSLQETLNKDIDAKIEKQLSKKIKNSSLPSLPSLNEEIDESLENKIANLEKQLRDRDEIITSQLKLIHDQKTKILTIQDKTIDYEDDFEEFDN